MALRGIPGAPVCDTVSPLRPGVHRPHHGLFERMADGALSKSGTLMVIQVDLIAVYRASIGQLAR
ncbi:hypothetical protein [Methylobacterium nonmethylotrophicum]|uniref:Uncharacterized protein n=1 Tax=Methylobacterium nonmethylotrophicum TaxID=1141884 RepID=A0A4Z0ND44_9HYPH|nr:hypothetical protein [Methylobacterium nonmethylotrophicum]TGD92746.1 hypothetical protein EU555_34360 [Methylobacterium nonmethylotrophicum]